jgi:cephalosporin hydroxylase
MDDRFEEEKKASITALGADAELKALSLEWIARASRNKYSYNFTWLGRPIIQFPQDVLALQEIHWRVRPDLVIETGIARGGSLVFHASMLELTGGQGLVLGIDVDIRPHNREAIEAHPLSRRITMIEGSSVSDDVVVRVREFARGKARPLVVLDSNHTHEHVRKELDLYSRFVKSGSYVVVFDTVIEDMPEDAFPDRAWGKGNNPKTAVREFLRSTDRFAVDRELEAKLLITVAPEGYLKCIKD